MKTQIKQEKGITLIALIVTIIILVILAAVTIRTVYDMGIMRYAVNGAEDYAKERDKEESILGSLENVLAEHKGGSKEKTSTITLDKQEGEGGTDTVVGTVGKSIPQITVPTKIGYAFQGYYESAGGQGNKYIDEEGNSAMDWDKEEATTLYAHWIANTYAATLDKQEGTGGTDTVTVVYGSSMPEITVPTKIGYTFQGYYESTGGEGTKYINEEGNSVTYWDKEEATTLYAYWIQRALAPEELESSIGKYVDYQSVIDAATNKTIYSSGTYNGYDASLSRTRGNLKWRILDVDTSSNIVRLIAATDDGHTLTLKGANGYNNGVKILNDICSLCYSSSVLGVTARSINIEDFERNGIGNVGQGIATMASVTSMYSYNSVPRIVLSEKNQWPNGTSSGSHTLGRSDQTSWVTGTSSYGSTYKHTNTNYTYGLSNFSNTADRPYYALFSAQTGVTGTVIDNFQYWVASRCVEVDSFSATFRIVPS